MATIKRFEEIEGWQKARELTGFVYEITRQERFAKDFGLKDQIRRAAVSAMSNIAEGFERDGRAEFVQFLSIAKASAERCNPNSICLDQGYISPVEFERGYTLCKETAISSEASWSISATPIQGNKRQPANPKPEPNPPTRNP